MTGILAPLAFVSLPILLMLAWLIHQQHERRRNITIRIGAPSPTPRFRVLMATLLPLCFMALAILRPYYGVTDITVPTATDDYLFVVDVSRSMYAKDIPPSRMELAKRKLKDLIDEFRRQGVPQRYGIVLFAGYSYLLCPITDDITVVKQFIGEISPAMVTSLGSNLEAGISTALARVEESASHQTKLLIVSDGEDDQLSIERIVRQIQTKKVRVDVLGVGTTAGGNIEAPNGTILRDQTGGLVITKLAEDSLKQIAAAGSGTYVRATLGDGDIRELSKRAITLAQRSKQRSREMRVFRELGSWLALAALVILLLNAGLAKSGALVRVLVLSLLFTETASATPLTIPAFSSRQAREAFEMYEDGHYEEARDIFKQLLSDNPSDRELQQGYASTLFKTGKHKEAAEIFASLAASSKNGREFYENSYNAGNALLALRKYQEAIDAFSRALKVKPGDERATHNKSIAQALLEEERRKPPTPTPPPTPSTNQQQSPQSSPSPSPDTSPSSAPSNPPPSQTAQSPEESPSPNGTSSPAASPSSTADENPQETPLPNDSGSISPTPAPTSEGEKSESDSPPSSPSPASNEQQPDDQRLRENQSDESPTPTTINSSQPTTPDDTEPSKREAQAWLESLPDSPLLIRREHGRPTTRGKTW